MLSYYRVSSNYVMELTTLKAQVTATTFVQAACILAGDYEIVVAGNSHYF
jgi:predicted house-cleaning NTP pyrophosphatase (Maf/HAM1 superfamily)